MIGGPEKRDIVIANYDPLWPELFRKHATTITKALGADALAIDHVGSTSVPGLAAKPIIDINLTVENSAEESSYLPALVSAGYVLRVREPDWHEHRMLRTREKDVHIHVYSRGCIELHRMLAFREWLRGNDEDRMLYETTKRLLAKEDWPDMNAYAQAKSEVVAQIMARALPG